MKMMLIIMQKYYKKPSSYKHCNDATSNKIKASTGYKYNNVMKPLLIKKGLVKLKLVVDSKYHK